MDLKKVVKLLELMESHGLDEVEIAEGKTRIRLRKGGAQPMAAPVIAAPVQVAVPNNGTPGVAAGAAALEAAGDQVTAPDESTVEITSPMVGTLFRAPSPDAEAFVNEGDTVTPDTVVCIIEAMKVMNEIKAEVEGEVVRILVEDGESVEYGQPIMVVRPRSSPQ